MLVEQYDAIIERNLKVVHSIAAKLARIVPRHIEKADLVQEGVIGLLRAARRYDAGRNVPESVYLATRIRGAMLDYLRRIDPLTYADRKRRKDFLLRSLDTEIHDTQSSDLDPEQLMVERNRCSSHSEQIAMLENALCGLNHQQRAIIHGHYWDGMTVVRAGAVLLGLKKSRAQTIHASALRTLRRKLCGSTLKRPARFVATQ
jgi:RNA polymerase sigma factor (sigma-70 family)